MPEYPAVDHRWLAAHVFYASNSNPMLVECVAPLARQLRADRLIDGFFFIKYWMEGPHVRVRMRPAPGVDTEAVRARMDAALQEFLRRRPALYEADPAAMADIYRQMYVAEYGEERWNAEYGADGVMPFRPNNSYAYYDYEPEYGRYGGPAGMALAEWHFEASSDLVIELLATTNVHVRTVLLGLSAQLSMMLCAVFLRDDRRIADFLETYRRFWEESYQENSDDFHDGFRRSYGRMDTALRRRMGQVRDSAAGRAGSGLGPVERRWLEHCRKLHARVVRLTETGQIWLARRGETAESPTTDLDAVLPVLLSSYVHMTNNRLGVSILDEIYLSYVLRTALLDDLELVGSA
jgi:thiopeptide-type bacteriocin biosynthesis protein